MLQMRIQPENEKKMTRGKPVFLGTGPFLYFPGPRLYFFALSFVSENESH